MTESFSLTQTRKAGLIAGITLLVIAITAPIGEFGLMPKLMVGGAAETVAAITAHRGTLTAAMFMYLIAFAGDVVLAWALYVFLAPADRDFSLLTAWFRVVYAAIALVAVLNLVTVWRLTGGAEYVAGFGADGLNAQVMLALDAFRAWWSFSFALFGAHLVLLGALTIRARYVPNLMAILLIAAGVGYFIDSFLKPFLFPEANTGFLMITFFGELVFMVWLLGWSWRIESLEPDAEGAR